MVSTIPDCLGKLANHQNPGTAHPRERADPVSRSTPYLARGVQSQSTKLTRNWREETLIHLVEFRDLEVRRVED